MLVGSVHEGDDPLLEVSSPRDTGYSIDGTLMRIRLAEPIPPGSSRTFTISWAYEVPPVGSSRNGTDDDVFYMAYWYPQFAVYDDINGWKADPYMGAGEFYMGYADYEVALTVMSRPWCKYCQVVYNPNLQGLQTGYGSTPL
jgi:hypothetical protein